MTGQCWNRSLSYVRRLTAVLGLCAAAVLAAACPSPTKPTPVPPEAPVIACPVAQGVLSNDNAEVTVSYPKPVTTGGAAPVTTTCTPGIGASFPVGTTTVTCTATDAQSRAASCAFPVTVQPALKLNASAVLAFGDSITEGKVASLQELFTLSGVGCGVFGTPTSYPSVLNSRFLAQYPTQALSATNCGWGGEEAVEGVVRLPTGLATGSYDVVLLMEGANDLSALQSGTQTNAVNVIANAIVTMIKTARSGRTVFVGTLTPQRPGGKRASRPEWVQPVNDRLRTVVPQEGAVLVDTWQALGGTPDPYVDFDGLHLTVAGYAKVADAFLSAMRTKLETKVTQ